MTVVSLTVDVAGNPHDVRVARSMSEDVSEKYKPIAKGLCAGHYRKANRLGVANKLDKANLAKLAKDGRATRWAKK